MLVEHNYNQLVLYFYNLFKNSREFVYFHFIVFEYLNLIDCKINNYSQIENNIYLRNPLKISVIENNPKRSIIQNNNLMSYKFLERKLYFMSSIPFDRSLYITQLYQRSMRIYNVKRCPYCRSDTFNEKVKYIKNYSSKCCICLENFCEILLYCDCNVLCKKCYIEYSHQ